MITKAKMNQLKEYFSKKPVDAVYLFGSQANEKATDLSDVDIGVLFKEKISSGKRFDLKLEMTSDLTGILKKERVDVVDLQKAPVAMRFSAVFPKKEIYIRNNKRRIVFEADTFSRYFDKAYFIKENTTNSLASIARM